jgi:ABC-type transport system substrate-binding protein
MLSTLNLYDTLVNLDFDLETITPGLAESWQVSPDGKTCTFALKKGVRFHNGKPFTTQDVKFTLDRWLDPATASPTKHRIAEIEEVTAKDDHTVVVRLKDRSNYLLFNLASGFASILKPEAITKHGADYGTLAVDGTGPFKFKEWVLRDRFVAERNPDYAWGPHVQEPRAGQAGTGRLADHPGRHHPSLRAGERVRNQHRKSWLTMSRGRGYFFAQS